MLKATFRQVAIRAPGGEIYDPSKRREWLSKLKDFDHLRHRADHCFEVLELLAKLKDQGFGQMVKRIGKLPAFKLLQTIVGVGPVIACGYIALIDTPHRFSRKNKLWAYACLGNKYHESDGDVYEQRRSKTGCRPLRWVVMQQFSAAVYRSQKPNRFKRQFEHLKHSGLGERTARRHVCRTMLSTVRAMWIKGQDYREQI